MGAFYTLSHSITKTSRESRTSPKGHPPRAGGAHSAAWLLRAFDATSYFLKQEETLSRKQTGFQAEKLIDFSYSYFAVEWLCGLPSVGCLQTSKLSGSSSFTTLKKLSSFIFVTSTEWICQERFCWGLLCPQTTEHHTPSLRLMCAAPSLTIALNHQNGKIDYQERNSWSEVFPLSLCHFRGLSLESKLVWVCKYIL